MLLCNVAMGVGNIGKTVVYISFYYYSMCAL